MLKSVTDYLEKTAELYPGKVGYSDERRSLTFSGLRDESRRVATALLKADIRRKPVLVYMDKRVEAVAAFLAIRYAGGFYVPVDAEAPLQRVNSIKDTCQAEYVICMRDESLAAKLTETGDYIESCVPDGGTCGKPSVLYYEDMLMACGAPDEDALLAMDRIKIDTDPVYAIFTSGSTGVPKGVVISERSAINFTEWYSETFDFSDKEIFANQTPFYFDASVKDIYATLRCGATMHIVPHKLFSLPAKLVEYLNEHEVNCIDWVPSVLCMIVNFNTFKKVKPLYLKKIMFLGEVMPTKQFNMWRAALPDVAYANLYGPTEATGDCTYYKVNREFKDDEPIPIGNACENTEVFLLKEDGTLAQDGEEGEICVRGCSLALGYYNDPEKTRDAFTPYPFQSAYEERIYHTGDIGRYNEYGEIIYMSRRDAQIKHMGHRIELGEIDNALSALDDIGRACCIYDKAAMKIVAFYEGDAEAKTVKEALKDKLPRYMLPNRYNRLDALPVNPNGKIDRVKLKEMLEQA